MDNNEYDPAVIAGYEDDDVGGPLGRAAESEASTFNKTSARPANKPLTRLHVFKNGHSRPMFYVGIDTIKCDYEPGRFILIFHNPEESVRITVEGRNLWEIFDYITINRWGAIAETREGVGKEGDAVITSIEIEPLGD